MRPSVAMSQAQLTLSADDVARGDVDLSDKWCKWNVCPRFFSPAWPGV